MIQVKLFRFLLYLIKVQFIVLEMRFRWLFSNIAYYKVYFEVHKNQLPFTGKITFLHGIRLSAEQYRLNNRHSISTIPVIHTRRYTVHTRMWTNVYGTI